MRSTKLVFFFTLIFPLFVTAQTNYKEGYIITNAGDTLKGIINYREWYSNPDKIDFKPLGGNTVMDVTPSDAREVAITGFETYQSFEVAISMNSLSLEKLSETANDSDIIKTVF